MAKEKKLTLHEQDMKRVERLNTTAVKALSHHEFTHRLMRVLGFVHAMPIRDGFPKDEFVIRSAAISNILIADMHDKMSIEAGTLSFIPQYCPYDTDKEKRWVHKQITDLFGKKRLDLFKEVEELRQAFLKDYDVKGFSQYAKCIYATHIYLDLVNAVNSFSPVKVVDGEVLKVRNAKKPTKIANDCIIPQGEEYITIDGDKMDMPRFYAYMVAMAEWKLEELDWGHHNIKMSLRELCKQIRDTKGVEIHYNDYKS